MTRIIRFLYQKEFFNSWLNNTLHKGFVKKDLTVKIRLGLFLIIMSFVVGWGFSFISELLAVYYQQVELAVLGGVFYLSSWGIFALGMYLTGRVNYEYAQHFLAQLINKKYIQKI